MKSPARIFTQTVLIVISVSLLTFCTSKKETSSESAEAVQEAPVSEEVQADEGWISLFDGETLDGWKRYNADEIGSLWTVEDGMIVCYSQGGGEAEADGGSLITVEQFGNFELELDFKISPTGNSGILYHIVEKPEYSHAYVTGPEYQLIDDENFPGGMTELQKTAGNYDMHTPAAEKPLNPPGEWNTAKIIYNNRQVEHWLNGVKVLEFEEGSDDWKSRYENSKWVEYDGWCEYQKGSIGLQDHGNYTWFKNIRVRKL